MVPGFAVYGGTHMKHESTSHLARQAAKERTVNRRTQRALKLAGCRG